MKIKKGDTIMVMSGKDRGKTGKVIRVSAQDARIAVDGIALQYRHRRPRRSGEKGQRVQVPGLISASSVQVVCGTCGKATRVGYRVGGASKERICKRCGAALR